MARRTKKQAWLTHDALLDAAEAAFRDKGVARTGVEDIARRAGCTRGAFYGHFRNKADVLAAMFARVTLPLYDSIQQYLERPQVDPFGDWRRCLVESICKLEQDSQQQSVCDILINRCELTEEFKLLCQIEWQWQKCFIGSTERMLEQARFVGQLDGSFDIPMVAFSIHATIQGLIRLWLRQPGQFVLTDTVADYVDVLVHGLKARGARDALAAAPLHEPR